MSGSLFQSIISYAVGPVVLPGGVIPSVEDVNGDGSPDLVVTNPADGTVAVVTGGASESGASSTSYAIAAAAAPFTFTVTRSGDTGAAATLGYAVSGSVLMPGAVPAQADAFVGGMYPSGQVSFAANQTTAAITVPVDQGQAASPMERDFFIVLSGPADAVFTQAGATGVIPGAGLPANLALMGRHDQYAVAPSGNGTGGQVTDLVAGRDGTHALSGLTTLRFVDGTGVFDPTGNDETVARLYQAAFARMPDFGGQTFWTEALDVGITPLAVAQGFVASGEFTRAYAGKDAAGFVTQLYSNVLHRAPDAPGAQFWAGQINNGASQAQVLLGFANSAEGRANTAATIHDGLVFLGGNGQA